MPQCCAYGCNVRRETHKGTHFHTFPNRDKSPKRYRIWVEFCKRKDFLPGPGARLCSFHFMDTDYEQTQLLKKQLMADENFRGPLLKPGTIPTIRKNEHNFQIPSSSKTINPSPSSSKSKRQRTERYEARNRKSIVSELCDSVPCKKSVNEGDDDKSGEREFRIEGDEKTKNTGVQCELGTEIIRKYILLEPENIYETSSDEEDQDKLKESFYELDTSDSDTSDNEKEEEEEEETHHTLK